MSARRAGSSVRPANTPTTLRRRVDQSRDLRRRCECDQVAPERRIEAIVDIQIPTSRGVRPGAARRDAGAARSMRGGEQLHRAFAPPMISASPGRGDRRRSAAGWPGRWSGVRGRPATAAAHSRRHDRAPRRGGRDRAPGVGEMNAASSSIQPGRRRSLDTRLPGHAVEPCRVSEPRATRSVEFLHRLQRLLTGHVVGLLHVVRDCVDVGVWIWST